MWTQHKRADADKGRESAYCAVVLSRATAKAALRARLDFPIAATTPVQSQSLSGNDHLAAPPYSLRLFQKSDDIDRARVMALAGA